MTTSSLLHAASTTDHGEPVETHGLVNEAAATAFIEQRLKPQLMWYESRSLHAKWFHQGLSLAQLIATAAIPLANLLANTSATFAIVSTALAGIAAIAIGWTNIARHQENWLRYRQTANGLQALLLHYQLKLPPYDGPERHELMITRAEEVLAGEGAVWVTQMRQRTPSPRPPASRERNEET